jgi:hypothetical protein
MSVEDKATRDLRVVIDKIYTERNIGIVAVLTIILSIYLYMLLAAQNKVCAEWIFFYIPIGIQLIRAIYQNHLGGLARKSNESFQDWKLRHKDFGVFKVISFTTFALALPMALGGVFAELILSIK